MGFKTAGSFLVTERCDLHCKYCFECYERNIGPDMDRETARKGVDFLYSEAIKSPVKVDVSVLLFGGEPLLRPDICNIIFEHCMEKRKETGINFNLNLITNATIMNDEIELLLYRWKSQCNLSIQLSIDGPKHINDVNRVRIDGSSAWDQIEKNVPIFQRISKVCFHSCLDKTTLPKAYEMYRFFVDHWKVKRDVIWFMPLHHVDWTMDDVKEYDKQLGYIFEHETKQLNTISIFTPVDKLCNAGQPNHPTYKCGAGNTYVSFTGDGQIWACHGLYFGAEKRPDLKPMRLGDLYWEETLDKEVEAIFEKATDINMGCGDCECFACYCCYSDNYVYCGDISKQIGKGKERCELSHIERKWQQKAMDWVQNLNKNNQCDCKQKASPEAEAIIELASILDNTVGRVEKLEKAK